MSREGARVGGRAPHPGKAGCPGLTLATGRPALPAAIRATDATWLQVGVLWCPSPQRGFQNVPPGSSSLPGAGLQGPGQCAAPSMPTAPRRLAPQQMCGWGSEWKMPDWLISAATEGMLPDPGVPVFLRVTDGGSLLCLFPGVFIPPVTGRLLYAALKLGAGDESV